MKRTLIALAIAQLFAVTAYAQKESPQPGFEEEIVRLAVAEGHKGAMDWAQWSEDFSQDMRSAFGTVFAGRVGATKVVKGAPYSAEVVTEMNRSLADGNVISKTTSSRVYRDGEGRTRQESGTEGKVRTVYITDPVEGRNVILMPGSKRAIAIPRAAKIAHEGHEGHEKRIVRVGGTEIRVEDGKVFVDGKEATGKIEVKAGGKDIRVEDGRVTIDGKEVSGKGAPKVIVKHIDANESDDGMRHEEVRVQVVRAGDAKELASVAVHPHAIADAAMASVMASLPGIQTMHFESTAGLGKGVATSLGMKDFDGVKAEGKSTVWTIPAGEIGNRNAILVTSESWYSPDLQLTVYSRYNDPRTGESVYRLAGIRRGEPTADLFKVPDGYQLRDKSKREEKR